MPQIVDNQRPAEHDTARRYYIGHVEPVEIVHGRDGHCEESGSAARRVP